MSAFGFTGAVTGLGHFGTGFTNVFDPNVIDVCTIEELCVKVDTLQNSINALTGLVLRNSQLIIKQENSSRDLTKLYSAIADIKREVLRGNENNR